MAKPPFDCDCDCCRKWRKAMNPTKELAVIAVLDLTDNLTYLNTMGLRELLLIPNIGKGKAKKILAARESYPDHRFPTLEHMSLIPGIASTWWIREMFEILKTPCPRCERPRRLSKMCRYCGDRNTPEYHAELAAIRSGKRSLQETLYDK